MNQRDDPVERRSHIRIQDTILFRWEPISEEECRRLTCPPFDGVTAETLCHLPSPGAMDNRLKVIREAHGPLASYLESIDRKLTLILNLLSINQEKDAGLKKHVVDLSAAGIAFDSPEFVPVNTCIRMWIALLPSHELLTTVGTVKRVDSSTPNIYRIAVKFDWVTEEHQDRLIEHIFHRQMLQLRMRRKKMEDEALEKE
ncbi:MAG: PilZ domain-containing protein [Deltaproteobacteria bacterium]